MPYSSPTASTNSVQPAVSDLNLAHREGEDGEDDDTSSTITTTSFASADSHLLDGESPSASSKSVQDQGETKVLSAHDKELAKLSERKAAMDAKFAQEREKLADQAGKETEKEQQALKKAESKHEREVRKQEEKFQKELAKLEQKKDKEAKKLAEKKRKQEDKDEKTRLTRERDEARAELELLRKEQEIYQRQIGDLQKENTTLVARLGKYDGTGVGDSPVNSRITSLGPSTGSEGRNRSSSILSRKKNKSDASSQAS
jgi:phage-related minor tail protein